MSKFQNAFARRRGTANERFYGDDEDYKKKPPAKPPTSLEAMPSVISPSELRKRIAAAPCGQEFSSNAF